MTDTNVTMNVNLQSNVAEEAARAERAVNSMTTAAGRDFAKFRSAAVLSAEGINSVGGAVNKLTGAGQKFKSLVKGVNDLETRLTMVGVRARLTQDEMKGLKKSLFDISQDPNIRLDPNELVKGLDALIAKTGDAKFAQENMRNLGLAMRATGASGPEVANVIASLRELNVTSPDQVINALGVINEKSKDAHKSFAEFASGSENLTSVLGETDAVMKQAAGEQLFADAATNANTLSAALESINAALQKKADSALAGQLKGLADTINSLSPEKLNNLIDYAANGAGAVAVMVGLSKAVTGTSNALKSIKGIKDAFTGAGGNKTSGAGVTRVFVTNWPLGGGYGGYVGDDIGPDGKKKKPTNTRKPGGRLGRIVGGIKNVLGPLTNAVSPYVTKLKNFATVKNLKNLVGSGANSIKKFVRGTPLVNLGLSAVTMATALSSGDTRSAVGAGGSLVGGLAGAKAGAATGALIGSVVPVVGTAVGGLLGGLLGGGLGAYFGEEGMNAIYDQFAGDNDETLKSNEATRDGMSSLTSAIAENTKAQRQKDYGPMGLMHPTESLLLGN